jgi:hypothetical protein
MKLLSNVLVLLGNEPTHLCPGCKMLHRINVNAPNENTGARWSWNGDVDRPTFHPSVNISNGQCHYFIRDGMIEFCTDTRHSLSGQTVPLPDVRPELTEDELAGDSCN